MELEIVLGVTEKDIFGRKRENARRFLITLRAGTEEIALGKIKRLISSSDYFHYFGNNVVGIEILPPYVKSRNKHLIKLDLTKLCWNNYTPVPKARRQDKWSKFVRMWLKVGTSFAFGTRPPRP